MKLLAPAPRGFEVAAAADAESVVVQPRGELDIATSDRLAAALRAVDSSAAVVVLDLSGLTFLDAAGLRVLIEAKQALGERLTLLPGPPVVQRMITLTGSGQVLGLAAGPDDPALDAAAANLGYMRELWATYRAGGTQALAERMAPATTPGGDRPVWGASELSAFWGPTVVPVPDPNANYRVQTLGDSVFVSAEGSSLAAGSSVIWSLYVFRGRTFIRALSLKS
jgi:anti-sigma B factor antagonist